MYHTKIEGNQQIDSGLGDSFGPDGVDESTVTQVQNSLNQLDVSENQNTTAQNETDEKIQIRERERVIKLLRQAYTPDEDNDTYLHLFIARGLEDKAIQLIEMCPQKELLDIQNNLGQTAMHVATYVNFHQVVTELVRHGAGIEYVDKDGKNVFHLCAERGHVETLEVIVRTACQMKQIEKVKTLLNERDFSGLTPFYLAVSNKHEQLCKRLVDLKVDVNLSDSKNGNSPLHEAIIDSDCSNTFVQFLTQKCNVDINSQNYAGVSPLHCAAGRGDASLFATLLFCGADVNMKDIEGNTPPMYGSDEIQQILNK